MISLRRLRASWLAPLLFFQGYLSLTIFLFFFGPWPWEVESPLLLVAYLGGAQVSIALGYLLAWKRVRRAQLLRTAATDSLAVKHGLRFLRLSLFATFVLLIPTSISRTGSLLPNVLEGITNAGAAYNANLERLDSGNSFVIVEYLRMLLSPILIGVVPLTIVYWSRLTWAMRLGGVFAVLANVGLYIATGTNKGLADFVVLAPWFIYLGVKAGVLRIKISAHLAVFMFAFLFLGFLTFFGQGQMQREGGVGELGVFNTGRELIYADSESLSGILSDNQRRTFESLARYVGQGYYALSLSFQIDHGTTYGLGHSMFLARNANAIFDTDYFSAESLPGVLEDQYGWGMYSLWHTIYPWLASDFGFFGSLVAIGAFGYLLSLSWGLGLATLQYRWLNMSLMMLMLFYYIPANNQIFQSGESCVAFFFMLAAISVRKYLQCLRSICGNSWLKAVDPNLIRKAV